MKELRIRSLNGLDFNSHVYGATYGYDLAGRMTSMQHPQNLAGSQVLDQYGYHPVTGALATVTGRTGHAFDFTYAHNGQMVRLRGPAYADTMVYDLAGRLVRRIETASVVGTLHDDTYSYDARGKLMQVAVGSTTGRSPSSYRQFYSGSGMLIATDWQNEFDSGRVQEAFGMDAMVMGNTAWRRTGDGTYSTVGDSIFRNTHDPGTGRLATIGKWHVNPDWREEITTRSYDPSGNVDWAAFEQRGALDEENVGVARWKGSRSFYAADERLRYFQERDLRGGTTPKHDGVWEEYRYDPLGRRILVNTRTKDLCNTGTAFQCASATTRMVWAGDQLIWELRQASESPGETSGPSDAYGTVSYMHAGGIDRPLVITKNGESVLPHQNWRGQFSRGTYASGASSDCAPGQNYNCAKVAWPGWRTTAWHVDAKDPDIRTWWGGLVDGMRDVSGQMYMRNGYYDPATGQFTQQDPIGIAGGLNTYGFAAGDPVSYSDPYGLCAQSTSDTIPEIGFCRKPIPQGGVRDVSLEIGLNVMPMGRAGHLLGRLAGGLRSLLWRRVAAHAGGGFTTKAAAREFASNLALPEAQATGVNRAIGRATSTSTIDITNGGGGAVVVTVTRPGRDGYQAIESTVGRDGTKSVVQKAYDAAGNLVHHDPKR